MKEQLKKTILILAIVLINIVLISMLINSMKVYVNEIENGEIRNANEIDNGTEKIGTIKESKNTVQNFDLENILKLILLLIGIILVNFAIIIFIKIRQIF